MTQEITEQIRLSNTVLSGGLNYTKVRDQSTKNKFDTSAPLTTSETSTALPAAVQPVGVCWLTNTSVTAGENIHVGKATGDYVLTIPPGVSVKLDLHSSWTTLYHVAAAGTPTLDINTWRQ